MKSKSTLSVVSAILIAVSVLFVGTASAKYPVARKRPPLAAAKDNASRFELPVDASTRTSAVQRVDIDLPAGKVTERIHTRLRSADDAAIIPSEMLDNPNVARSLAPLTNARAIQPQATLVADDLIVIRHPKLNGDHFVPFRSTAVPTSQRLEEALAKLPEHLYTQHGGIDAIVFDGKVFSVVVEGNTIPLILPPFTRRESASHTTYAAP